MIPGVRFKWSRNMAARHQPVLVSSLNPESRTFSCELFAIAAFASVRLKQFRLYFLVPLDPGIEQKVDECPH